MELPRFEITIALNGWPTAILKNQSANDTMPQLRSQLIGMAAKWMSNTFGIDGVVD